MRPATVDDRGAFDSSYLRCCLLRISLAGAGTGLPYRAISISVGLFWGAVIIAVISLFANLIIRNRESD